MKKSRMLLLFGGLLLMLVGYVAWCGRTFYMKPSMHDLSQVPIEARELALAGIKESGLLRQTPFQTLYVADCPPL